MHNQKVAFKEWMIGRKTTKKDGGTYTIKTVDKCATTLNTVLDKFEIHYASEGDNTIFLCESYAEFLSIDCEIRNSPKFDFLDGPGKGQRWIHNGLLLYGYYLLDKEGISEENREDSLESIVSGHGKEGKKLLYYTTKYERKKEIREAAILAHGLKCQCCGFDFQKTYGELGKGFIEVHHIIPLSYSSQEVNVNIETDLVCLCSNCHRMIHRKRDQIITLEELKTQLHYSI